MCVLFVQLWLGYLWTDPSEILIRCWFLSRAGWLQHHLPSLHSEEVLHKPLHKASVEDWSMHILGWVHRNQDIVGPTDMMRFLRLWIVVWDAIGFTLFIGGFTWFMVGPKKNHGYHGSKKRNPEGWILAIAFLINLLPLAGWAAALYRVYLLRQR